MKTKPVLFAVALLLAAPAWAINKCTGANGKVTYQEAACASTEAGETVKWTQANGSGSSKQLPFKVVALSPEKAREEAMGSMSIARQRLKDPSSAMFTDVRVLNFNAQGKNYTMTCGELNAKNSYGGYVGAKSFWVYNGLFTETFDHFLPGSNLTWLMGSVQTECLKNGTSAPLS